MKRLLCSLLLIALLSSMTRASTAVFVGRTDTSATANNYNYIQHGGSENTTMTNRQFVCAGAGTLKKLYAWSSVAPGDAKTWTVTVFKGADATALSVAITGAATTYGTDTEDVAFVAGDLLSIKITSSGTPAAAALYWNVDYEPTTANQQFLCGTSASTALSTSSTEYIAPVGATDLTTTSTARVAVIPLAGTISKLRAVLDAAPGADKNRVVTLMVNNAASTLARTWGAADTTVTDDTNSVSVSAGDRLVWRFAPVATPAASIVKAGFVFTPSSAGKFALLAVNRGNVTVDETLYYAALTYNNDPSTTESTVSNYVRDLTISAAYGGCGSGTPGTGEDYTFTLNDDGSPTALSFVVSGTNQWGSDTGSVSVALGSLLSTSAITSAGAADRGIVMGYAVEIPTGGGTVSKTAYRRRM